MTPIYQRIMATLEEIKCHEVAAEVKAKWGATPWIISVKTDDEKYLDHRHWLFSQHGEENDHIRGVIGNWQLSGVTIDGITRLGFKTEYAMNRFKKAFPDDIVE